MLLLQKCWSFLAHISLDYFDLKWWTGFSIKNAANEPLLPSPPPSPNESRRTGTPPMSLFMIPSVLLTWNILTELKVPSMVLSCPSPPPPLLARRTPLVLLTWIKILQSEVPPMTLFCPPLRMRAEQEQKELKVPSLAPSCPYVKKD